MNQIKQLFYIFRKHEVVTIAFACKALHCSESKIRNLLKELRSYGKVNGFRIKTKSVCEYYLEIVEVRQFKMFCEQLEQISDYDASNREYRKCLILYTLLRTAGYLAIEDIARTADVSRKTVESDLKMIRRELKQTYEIQLVSKSHYGIRLEGNERHIRKLFLQITDKLGSIQNIKGELINLCPEDEFESLGQIFQQLLQKHEIYMTKNAVDAVLFHIQILLFRLKQNHVIEHLEIDGEAMDDGIRNLSTELVDYLEEQQGVKVPEREMLLLASQITGKALSQKIPECQKERLMADIENAFAKIDEEYVTGLSSDGVLKENLMLHIHPLLLRLSTGLDLSNSMIHTLPAQFTYAFLMALRFIEYHDVLRQYQLSQDEISYLAMHFATHNERKNQAIIKSIRSVAFIYENMRGDSLLIQTRIESIFPNASVRLVGQHRVENYNLELVDFVISTVPINDTKVFYVMIQDIFDDDEAYRIRNAAILNGQKNSANMLRLTDLFFEELFFRAEPGSYYEILEMYSTQAEAKGYAKEGFSQSVLERENRLNTIYDHGVAVPHSIQPLAHKDSIILILLNEAIEFEEKMVKCIFMINICSGHMFLHQEISKYITRLIKNPEQVNKIWRSQSLKEFLYHVK